jgi:hypothetical protein
MPALRASRPRRNGSLSPCLGRPARRASPLKLIAHLPLVESRRGDALRAKARESTARGCRRCQAEQRHRWVLRQLEYHGSSIRVIGGGVSVPAPQPAGHPGRAASGGEVTACRDRLAGEPCGSVGSGSPSRGHWRRCDVVKRVADCPFAGTKAQLGRLSRRATTSADAPAPRRRLRLVGVQLGADRFPVHDAPDLRRCRRPSGPLAHAAACSGSSQSSRYLREKSGERSQRSARSATSTSTRGGAGRLRGGPEVWPQRGLPAPRAAGPRAAVPSLSRLSEARCRFSTDARAARVPIARWRAPAPRPFRSSDARLARRSQSREGSSGAVLVQTATGVSDRGELTS